MENILKYTKEQCGILDIVNSNKQILINGPAGTGKTFIAIELAKNLALEIIGLMGIPPLNKEVDKYFNMLNQLRKKLNLKHFILCNNFTLTYWKIFLFCKSHKIFSRIFFLFFPFVISK